MNNGGTFNQTTYNGYVADFSVRIYIVSLAYAVGQATGRVWRRSPVNAEAQALPAEGRVWRRSPQIHEAQAQASITVRVLHWVREAAVSVAQAIATITAFVKPQTPVRSPVLSRAVADAVVTGHLIARLSLTGYATADAQITARRYRRAPVAGIARAAGFIKSNVYQQLPWDEPAPDDRVFIVPQDDRTFYVGG